MGLLFKLAEERLTKAQIELKHTFTLAVVKELLTKIEQFLWAGHGWTQRFPSPGQLNLLLVHHCHMGC